MPRERKRVFAFELWLHEARKSKKVSFRWPKFWNYLWISLILMILCLLFEKHLSELGRHTSASNDPFNDPMVSKIGRQISPSSWLQQTLVTPIPLAVHIMWPLDSLIVLWLQFGNCLPWTRHILLQDTPKHPSFKWMKMVISNHFSRPKGFPPSSNWNYQPNILVCLGFLVTSYPV